MNWRRLAAVVVSGILVFSAATGGMILSSGIDATQTEVLGITAQVGVVEAPVDPIIELEAARAALVEALARVDNALLVINPGTTTTTVATDESTTTATSTASTSTAPTTTFPATTTTSTTSTTTPPVVTTTTTIPTTGIYGAGVAGAALPIPPGAIPVTPLTIVKAINDNPVGTDFALAAGTYRLGSLPVKAGNGYYGLPSDHLAVVFDGESTKTVLFLLADNNVVANLSVRRYVGIPLDRNPAGDNITIRNVEVSESQTGIRFGASGWKVSYVTSRDHGTFCFSGSGQNHNLSRFIGTRCGNADGLVPQHPTSDRGGSKFVLSDGWIVEDGEFADIDGNAMWFDIGNRNFTVRRLYVHDTLKFAIDIEASYGPGVVEDNVIVNAGSQVNTPYHFGCMSISMTENVTVRDNVMSGCVNGIIGYQWNHPQWLGTISGTVQASPLRNLLVVGNIITASNHSAGIASLTSILGCDANAACANNQFTDNTYLDAVPEFWWDDATRGLAYWTSEGFD